MKKKEIIEELTIEQDKKLDLYYEEFLKRGLSLEPIDHERASQAILACYKMGDIKTEPQIEWLPSPFSMLVRAAILETIEKRINKNKEIKKIENEVNELFDIRKPFSEEAKAILKDLQNHICYGQHEAGWHSWISFFRNEVGLIEETEEATAIIETSKECHWWLPFENRCLASERPIEMHLNNPGGNIIPSLHKDLGPAILYADGFSLYYLNGVEMPQEIVETPADKLDPKIILREKNVEIRREIVRKIGINRICEGLNAKCIDKKEDYELLLLDLGDGRRRPYLKMKNPSIDAEHIEGCHPDCDTVEKALAWRNSLKTYKKPEVLT